MLLRLFALTIVASAAAQVSCTPDLDNNGSIELNDFFQFVDCYINGDSKADMDCNNTIDNTDVELFLEAFQAFCNVRP